MCFLWVKTPLKILFWCGVKLHHHISFNIFHILKLYPRDEFSVEVTRKSYTKLGHEYSRWCTGEILCFIKSCWSESIVAVDQKVLRLLIRKYWDCWSESIETVDQKVLWLLIRKYWDCWSESIETVDQKVLWLLIRKYWDCWSKIYQKINTDTSKWSLNNSLDIFLS